MKFIVKILLSIIFVTSLVFYFACNKDKLNVPPPTPTEASYFSSEIEFRSAILGVYAVLSDYFSSSNSAGGSGSAELETFFLPGDDLTSQTEEVYEIFGNNLNSTEGKIQQIWGSSYILLNRANKVKHFEVLSKGGLTNTIVDPRIIFLKALEVQATSIVLCHNHPSGNLKPSRADEELTARLKSAGMLLDIKVVDHLIVSDEGYYSFADDGMM